MMNKSRDTRKKILFIMHLPPPVHGAAMVSRQIQQSVRINESFRCKYVNLSASRRADEVTNYSPLRVVKKLFRFSGALLKTLKHLVCFRPNTCYITLTCHGIPFLKDAPFVLLCKLFRCKIIIHQHNKGMSTCAGKFPYNFLLPWVYKNTTVILLSELLYDDISCVVQRNQVKICPNGI